MTDTQRVIYLPPGMVANPAPAPPMAYSGIPFDRAFFEQVLPQTVQSFCKQVECPTPVVELMTVDGSTHYVNNVAGVADHWVALQTTHEEKRTPVQVFLPYNTIFRVEIHPEPDGARGHLGFVLESAKRPAPVVATRRPRKGSDKK